MKGTAFGFLLMLSAVSTSSVAYAQVQEASGAILHVWADPSDFVVQLDSATSCGSFFNVQRSNANFKEVVATILTAFSTTKRMIIYYGACAQGRNIVDHVGI